MQVMAEAVVAVKPWAIRNLPPFPRVASRLLEILSQEDAVIRQVAELIRMDTAFGAEILKLANSAAYGFSSRVDNLVHAIVLLGTERVKALTMTVALGIYSKSAFKQEALRRCWQHSLACAFLSEELAASCSMHRDRAYTTGLLHDVGRLGLLVGFPNEYVNLIAVVNENGTDELEVERAMFDIDHCEAGRWLAEEFRFPKELCEAIAHHHAEPTAEDTDTTTLARLACRLASTLGFEAVKQQRLWTVDEIRDQLPERTRNRWAPDPEELVKSIRSKISSVAG